MIVGPILSALQLATAHLEFRHLMRRRHRRDGVFDNVIAHVSGAVCVNPANQHRAPASRRTRHRPGRRRRRSRAAGLSIASGPRSGIPIPAP